MPRAARLRHEPLGEVDALRDFARSRDAQRSGSVPATVNVCDHEAADRDQRQFMADLRNNAR